MAKEVQKMEQQSWNALSQSQKNGLVQTKYVQNMQASNGAAGAGDDFAKWQQQQILNQMQQQVAMQAAANQQQQQTAAGLIASQQAAQASLQESKQRAEAQKRAEASRLAQEAAAQKQAQAVAQTAAQGSTGTSPIQGKIAAVTAQAGTALSPSPFAGAIDTARKAGNNFYSQSQARFGGG